jgi:Arc/MetJ-type ribon-helix-helix transcriptional regulator
MVGWQQENNAMTIHLPNDIERDILAEVHNGHFASVDDALAEAWRSFQRQRQSPTPPAGHGSLGAMQDAADELDEVVEHAMQLRRQPWRAIPGE